MESVVELITLYFTTLLPLLILSSVLSFSTNNDDPSSFPGHMQPLGSHQQIKEEIEVLSEYPSPQEFFSKYIKQSRPFLVKQGAKHQPAYKYWNDAYIRSFPETSTEMVDVEPNHKENRDAKGFSVSFQEFLSRYHNEYLYLVNKVPQFLQKDVTMPSPLTCNNTRELILDHIVWMSSGGTKSVLHSDDLDNINCVYRGSKYLLLVNPGKYNADLFIDKPQGGYSSLDVDRVNFTKFPSLRDVEFQQCHMEEGDCLFIPWRWYHQVNSMANSEQQNIAVNIWFEHKPDHTPQKCNLPEDQAMSIDHFQFKGLGKMKNESEEIGMWESVDYPLLSLYQFSLSRTKFNRANLNTFNSILQKIPGIFVDRPIHDMEMTATFKNLALQMFGRLNINNDKYITYDDFHTIFESTQVADGLESWLELTMFQMKEDLTSHLPAEKDEL